MNMLEMLIKFVFSEDKTTGVKANKLVEDLLAQPERIGFEDEDTILIDGVAYTAKIEGNQIVTQSEKSDPVAIRAAAVLLLFPCVIDAEIEKGGRVPEPHREKKRLCEEIKHRCLASKAETEVMVDEDQAVETVRPEPTVELTSEPIADSKPDKSPKKGKSVPAATESNPMGFLSAIQGAVLEVLGLLIGVLKLSFQTSQQRAALPTICEIQAKIRSLKIPDEMLRNLIEAGENFTYYNWLDGLEFFQKEIPTFSIYNVIATESGGRFMVTMFGSIQTSDGEWKGTQIGYCDTRLAEAPGIAYARAFRRLLTNFGFETDLYKSNSERESKLILEAPPQLPTGNQPSYIKPPAPAVAAAPPTAPITATPPATAQFIAPPPPASVVVSPAMAVPPQTGQPNGLPVSQPQGRPAFGRRT